LEAIPDMPTRISKAEVKHAPGFHVIAMAAELLMCFQAFGQLYDTGVSISYADIRTFKKKPYVVGGNQEPTCNNCLVDDGLAGALCTPSAYLLSRHS